MTSCISTTNRLGSLNLALKDSLIFTPAEHGATQIRLKWGEDLDPVTTQLVTLDYDYHGHPPINGVYQGQIRVQQSLVQGLLSDYQAVGDNRFAETAFGLYTPPAVGPEIKLVANVDEFAFQGSGNHKVYEGIYRRTDPQTYGPSTQLAITAAEFKKWVWNLDYKELYQEYLYSNLPSDATIMGSEPYALRTSMKTAFVMAAFLQNLESSLTLAGLQLALSVAGLGEDAVEFSGISSVQLEQRTFPMAHVEVSRLMIYRYTARDLWVVRHRRSGVVLLYVPGNSSPLHQFANMKALRAWIVEQGKHREKRVALCEHFEKDDRSDGTFHAGVLTALQAMAQYPKQHHLTRESGFFNNDGYWNPDDYILLDTVANSVDPFAELVKVFKQTSLATAEEAIRDDADVNRDNLAAVINPVIGWINRWGALAIFFPGGEGLLGLAGLIDAAQGVSEVVEGESRDKINEGVTRTVFGLLNALPLLIKTGVALAGPASKPTPRPRPPVLDEGGASIQPPSEPIVTPSSPHVVAAEIFIPPGAENVPVAQWTRPQLMRGFGQEVEGVSDDRLELIRRVSGVSDEQLRQQLITGARPKGLFADTLLRFKTAQRVEDYITQLGSVQSPLGDLHLARWLTSDSSWPRGVGLRLVDGNKVIWETAAITAEEDVLVIHPKGGSLFKDLARRLGPEETRQLLGDLLEPGEPYPPTYVRARLIHLKARGIAHDQRLSMFEEHYNVLTKPQSDLQKALAHEYPSLPLSVRDQMLLDEHISPDSTLTLAETKALFQRLEPQVSAYEHELRLVRAYEGAYLDSIRNVDSDTLLLHSARRMPGWNVPITVREGSASGVVVDRIGAPSLPKQRIIIRATNRYRCPDSTPTPGYITDDFGDALVASLTDAEFLKLGVQRSLDNFKFKLRLNLLNRREFETVLRRQQLRTPFFEPEEGSLLGGAGGRAAALRTDRMLVDTYIPGFTDLQVSEFMECFDWVDDAQAELQRIVDTQENLSYISEYQWSILEDEYFQKENEAYQDGLSIDSDDELPDAPIDEEDKLEWIIDQSKLDPETPPEWFEELRRLYTWRGAQSQKVYRNGRMIGFKLDADFTVSGNRPLVDLFTYMRSENLQFNSVVAISEPEGMIPEYLEIYSRCFPRLEILEIQNVIRSGLPAELVKFPRLRQLKLTSNGLSMPPEESAFFSQMTALESLDLSGNNLGTPPSIATLTKLRRLTLNRTGLTTVPEELFEHQSLEFLGLEDNNFTSIPRTVDLRQGLDLNGNPFNDLNTFQRLLSFERETGVELWVNNNAPLLNQPVDWLRGLPESEAAARTTLWRRVAAQELVADPGATSILSRFAKLSGTAEYQAGYEGLRKRLWLFIKRIVDADEMLRVYLRSITNRLAQVISPAQLLRRLEEAVIEFDSVLRGELRYPAPKYPRLE